MKVRYTPRARNDIVQIAGYLSERSLVGARNVRHAIDRVIELIGEHPHSGRRAGEQGTRMLPVGHYPYIVYWKIEADEAWIVHIRHAARQPWRDSSL